jgi:hypothetical protein
MADVRTRRGFQNGTAFARWNFPEISPERLMLSENKALHRRNCKRTHREAFSARFFIHMTLFA